MIGGIYFEIPFGDIYDENRRYACREHAMRIIGSKFVSTFDKKRLDNALVNTIFKKAKETVSKRMSSLRRGYYNRTVDLMRSTCVGFYLDGKLVEEYRYTGGTSEKSPKTKHEVGPAERASAFLRQYRLLVKSRFTVVIAATMPYAVKLEKVGIDYEGVAADSYSDKKNIKISGTPVLIRGIEHISTAVLRMRPHTWMNRAVYGYIFESSGARETVKTGM